MSEGSSCAPSPGSLEHSALVRRVLRIDETVWRQVLDEYHQRLTDDTPAGRLRALGEAWKSFSPQDAPLSSGPASRCPACGGETVRPEVQRRSGETYGDRKSTRLNSSHLVISYAVFCLKKKK